MPFKPIDTHGSGPPAQYFEPDPATVEAFRRTYDALKLLRGLVQEGGVPRYSVTPGAALNAAIEEDVDPALQHAEAAIRSLTAGREIHSSDGGVEGHARSATNAGTAPQQAASGTDRIEAPVAGIKPGPSEATPSGYADYTPVTVRAHTVVRQDCTPAGTVSEGEMAIWLYKAIPSISSADCDRIARALLSKFDIRRKP